jgi:hypothetical protein
MSLLLASSGVYATQGIKRKHKCPTRSWQKSGKFLANESESLHFGTKHRIKNFKLSKAGEA